MLVAPDRHQGQAGKAGADHVEAGTLKMHQMPGGRQLNAEMHVIREQGATAVGTRPANHPVVGCAGQVLPGRGVEGEQILDLFLGARGRRRCRSAIRHALAGIEGHQLRDPLGRESPRKEAVTAQLRMSVVREVVGHELAPHQHVRRAPGIRLEAQQTELRGQGRIGCQIRVDPFRIGIDRRPRLGTQAPIGCLGGAVKAPGSEITVTVDGVGPQDLGQAPGADPALKLHLPQPVLGVDHT